MDEVLVSEFLMVAVPLIRRVLPPIEEKPVGAKPISFELNVLASLISSRLMVSEHADSSDLDLRNVTPLISKDSMWNGTTKEEKTIWQKVWNHDDLKYPSHNGLQSLALAFFKSKSFIANCSKVSLSSDMKSKLPFSIAAGVLRRLRPEAAPVQFHRRVREMAQRDQAAPEPQLRGAGEAVPQETSGRIGEDRSSDGGCEIVMGNYSLVVWAILCYETYGADAC